MKRFFDLTCRFRISPSPFCNIARFEPIYFIGWAPLPLRGRCEMTEMASTKQGACDYAKTGFPKHECREIPETLRCVGKPKPERRTHPGNPHDLEGSLNIGGHD